MPLKLCFNMYPFRWLKFNIKRASKFVIEVPVFQKESFPFLFFLNFWIHGVGITTTAQLDSTSPELWFYVSSIPSCGVSEVFDGESPRQLCRLEVSCQRNSKNNSFHSIHPFYFWKIYLENLILFNNKSEKLL